MLGRFLLLFTVLFLVEPAARADSLPLPPNLIASTSAEGVALLIGAAVWFSGVPSLALGTAGGVLGALVVLGLAAWAVRRGARRAARSHWVRGRSALRLALGAIGGPREEASSVILSLGLGLSFFYLL